MGDLCELILWIQVEVEFHKHREVKGVKIHLHKITQKLKTVG